MRKSIVLGIAIAIAVVGSQGLAHAGPKWDGFKAKVGGLLNRNKPANLTPARSWDGKAAQPVAAAADKSAQAQIQHGRELLGAANTAGNARRGLLSAKIARLFLGRAASSGSPGAQIIMKAQEGQIQRAQSHANLGQRAGMRIQGRAEIAVGSARVLGTQAKNNVVAFGNQVKDSAIALRQQAVNSVVNSKPAAAIEIGVKRTRAAGQLVVGGLGNLGAALDKQVAATSGYSANVQQRRQPGPPQHQ